MKIDKATPLKKPKAQLISCNGIAKELNRSARGVSDVIERLKIKPEHDLPGGRYYRRDAIDKVRNAMRAENKKAKPTSTQD